MDQELLVETKIDDGARLIAELVRSGFEVAVAFWALSSEEGLWSLYIGSPAVAPEKLGDAYRALYPCLSRIPDSCLGMSEVQLVSSSDPIARDAIAVRDRFPGRVPRRCQGKRLGNLSLAEVYIYPQATGPMTPTEVLQTVLGLMNRAGQLQPSVVTLRDGSTIRAIPTGIQKRPPGGVQVTLLDVGTNTERVVDPDEVVNVR